MKAAVLIHTRTLHCDFSPDFLVRPERFTGEDIQWARKYVLQATGRVDELRGFRWLVADNGGYRLVGVVGFLEDIAKSCKNLTNEELVKSSTLTVDEKGRRVYAFIGMVVYGTDRCCAVSLETLWKEYVQYISPVWERSYLETIFTEAKEIDSVNATESVDLPDGKKWNQRRLYESNRIVDQKLFACYARSLDSDFSFCSNLKGVADIKKTMFTVVTASSNDMTRLLSEGSVTGKGNFVPPPTDSFIQSSRVTEKPTPSATPTESRKKTFHSFGELLDDIYCHYSDIDIFDAQCGSGFTVFINVEPAREVGADETAEVNAKGYDIHIEIRRKERGAQ